MKSTFLIDAVLPCVVPAPNKLLQRTVGDKVPKVQHGGPAAELRG